MNIILLTFLIIFVMGWTLGGIARCIQRYQEEDFEEYGLTRTIFCHILEGPLSWLIGLLMAGMAIIGSIQHLFRKNN